jgi:hypothetical protein
MEDLPDLYLLEQADSKTVLRPFGSRKPISETNLEKDIEEWVMASMLRGIPVLGELALFARQPSYRASKARRPDLLALDAERNVVVIEFKRDHADEDILFQTLNYAAWISQQSYETLDRFAARFLVELPAPQPTSLKEAYYKAFPASTGDEAEEAEAALPSDQEFLAGFNSRPRIVIVAAEIAEEIQRILRFLTSHGIRCEAHEFQYFESPKGDRLIHRRAVARMKTATPKPDGGPAYATLDDLNSYVLEPIVRPWIDALPEWVGDEFESGEASLSVPGNGNLRIRLFGKNSCLRLLRQALALRVVAGSVPRRRVVVQRAVESSGASKGRPDRHTAIPCRHRSRPRRPEGRSQRRGSEELNGLTRGRVSSKTFVE